MEKKEDIVVVDFFIMRSRDVTNKITSGYPHCSESVNHIRILQELVSLKSFHSSQMFWGWRGIQNPRRNFKPDEHER